MTTSSAPSLGNLSNWLSELGRREDALAAIDQAVTIRRRLADARPDAFLPDLARSLINQSNQLSELGRREDALAAARPAVFMARLKSSLMLMADALEAVGREPEAD